MKVSAEDVKHIAQLSRLTVPASETTPYVLPVSNVLREDVVKEGVSHEEALKNAPAVHNDGFKVPRVIE